MLKEKGEIIDIKHTKLRDKKDEILLPLVNALPKKVRPNHITFIRLIIVLIWFPFAIKQPAWYHIFIFFIPAYFTDLLDGALARTRKQKTYLGKYFDIICDRLNDILLFYILIVITNYSFLSLKALLIFEILLFFFTFIEYYSKNNDLAMRRQLIQFCVFLIIIIFLLAELI